MMMLRLEVDRLRINMFLAEEFIRSSIAYGDENILRNAPALNDFRGFGTFDFNEEKRKRCSASERIQCYESLEHFTQFCLCLPTAAELKGSKASQSQTDIFPFQSLYK